MQWASGAWAAGWAGADADIPAHVVSALVVREYVREGLLAGRGPVEFAQEFYQRFPKVAIGHWPPMFHGSLGIWMLATPLAPAWILGFQAILAGLLAGLTVLLGSMVLGVRKAVLAGVLVVVSPAVMRLSMSPTPDIMTAVWVTGGLTAFAHYWRRPGWLAATLFGLCAAGALLTKPSGGILAFTPLLCIVATRRWSLLREPSFWWPAVLVVAVYGPWQAIFTQEMADGWRAPRHWMARFAKTPLANLVYITRILGIAGTILAGYGVWRLRKCGTGVVLACTAAGAYLLYAFLLPSRGLRHYIPLAPVMAILAVAGIAAALQRLGVRRSKGWEWVILLAVFTPGALQLQDRGASRLVEDLLKRNAADQTLLVTGSPALEGEVIAESALRRPSRGLTVYRGLSCFFKSDWGPWSNRLVTGSPNEAEEMIEKCRIDVVIIGKGTPLVVAEAVGRNAERWRLAETRLKPEVGIVFERIGAARAGLGAPVIQKP